MSVCVCSYEQSCSAMHACMHGTDSIPIYLAPTGTTPVAHPAPTPVRSRPSNSMVLNHIADQVPPW